MAAEIRDHDVASEELTQYIERIERLNEDKKAISDDIKDVFAEAKAMGYDTKGMRRMISLRKLEKDARDEQDAIDETYRNALKLD
jgi:uncharacterized protein (UPF0335 family)